MPSLRRGLALRTSIRCELALLTTLSALSGIKEGLRLMVPAGNDASNWLTAPGRRPSSTVSRPATGGFRKEVRADEQMIFGKHKGFTFQQVLLKDPGYARWCSEQEASGLSMRRFIKFAMDQGVLPGDGERAVPAAAGHGGGMQSREAPQAVSVDQLDLLAYQAPTASAQPAWSDRRSIPAKEPPGQVQTPSPAIKQRAAPSPPKDVPGATRAAPSELFDAFKEAMAGYSGTIDIEILGSQGFSLIPLPRLPAAATQILENWPKATSGRLGGSGAEGPVRTCFPADMYLAVVRKVEECARGQAWSVRPPPSWVLAVIPAFRIFGKVKVKKSIAHVILADALADGQASSSTGALRAGTGVSREGQQLLPYQQESVLFALKRGGRVLLADEMGLGKTAQALVIAAQYAEDWPVLVVCPSTLRSNWREETTRWIPEDLLPDPEQNIQVIMAGKEKLRPDARFIIVSYDLAARNENFCHTADGTHFRVVICDEAHYLKNPDSQRSRCMSGIMEASRRCILLSGTPALGKASELYMPMSAILPGLLPSYKLFCERYCNKDVMMVGRNQVKRWKGSRLGWELRAVLEANIMIRRYKKDVLSQLPAKRRQRVVLDKLVSCPELTDLEAKLRSRVEDGGADPSISEQFRLTGLAKLEVVKEYLEYLVEANCRFLLFAHHIAVMDGLQGTLEKLNCNFIRVDGSTPPTDRELHLQRFQQDESVQVALLSITACGQGVNLQCVSTVVFAELHWTPGVLVQAEDRAHRMGQQNCVNVHYLIAKGTLDDAIFKMLDRKHKDVGVMLDGEASHMNAQEMTPALAQAAGNLGTALRGTKRPAEDLE